MTNKFEEDYRSLLSRILMNGHVEHSRAGEVQMLFGETLMIDLQEGFPIVTAKKIFFDKAKAEFWWMWYGSTNVKQLRAQGIEWWDEWADEFGDLGPTYGHQVRNFGNKCDQIKECHSQIVNHGRRAVLTFWNPNDNKNTKLPPCYTSMVFVRIGSELHMEFNIRSSDVGVGLPYDIVLGALFLNEMAKLTLCRPRFMKVNLSNAHNYTNNNAAAYDYLDAPYYEAPQLETNGNYALPNYQSGKVIKMILNT